MIILFVIQYSLLNCLAISLSLLMFFIHSSLDHIFVIVILYCYLVWPFGHLIELRSLTLFVSSIPRVMTIRFTVTMDLLLGRMGLLSGRRSLKIIRSFITS